MLLIQLKRWYVSGSVGDRQIRALAAEVQGILAAYPHVVCDLYYWGCTMPRAIPPERPRRDTTANWRRRHWLSAILRGCRAQPQPAPERRMRLPDRWLWRFPRPAADLVRAMGGYAGWAQFRGISVWRNNAAADGSGVRLVPAGCIGRKAANTSGEHVIHLPFSGQCSRLRDRAGHHWSGCSPCLSS